MNDKNLHTSDYFYQSLPIDIEGCKLLIELALDLNWSWNHATDKVWRDLDPELWAITHNPWDVLQTVSRDRIDLMLADSEFRANVEDLIGKRQKTEAPTRWFQQAHEKESVDCIAYFCMEFMLSEALPIYSGGLGNVAGDQLKAASDLGVPVVGVGLLYQRGYFRQVIDPNGAQQALYPYNDPGQLPITPLRDANGEWLRLKINLPVGSIWLRTWQVIVGNVRLYLLDSNDAANYPEHRGITSELYGGDSELRLKQELILGIGGWRLLEALGIHPEVCHLNEGHAAFAVLERAASFMEKSGQSFEVALTATRPGNVFTTHTAVSAGFDRFSPELIERYLGAYAQRRLGIGISALLALGRSNPADSQETFNMAALAIHGSGAVNGVSKLHGQVSRNLFQPLFPRWPRSEIPIGHVTNGVHMSSWESAEANDLWTAACGKSRWLGETDLLEQQIRKMSDTCLWNFRLASSKTLVKYARARSSLQQAASGAGVILKLLNPDVLTLGFARRFATYKRPNLLLHDPERLLRILTSPDRPVQLILAGKAHPADKEGQMMIQEWNKFISRPEARLHVIFISDYDMQLTEHLVRGVDVWINTPRRPWEACGTSGMKVLVNGGINLSELDGWWAEAYTPEVGWALGDGLEHGDDPKQDALEAEALYNLLEQEVIPEFYTRNDQGIPVAWVTRMRASMASLTPQFSTNRSVRDYTEAYYLPAAAAYRQRAADQGRKAREIGAWQQSLEQKWETLRFAGTTVETRGRQHEFNVQLFLNGLDPESVKVELYAEDINGEPVYQKMTRMVQSADGSDCTGYHAVVSAQRPAADYTARVVPIFPGARVPLEDCHILWND
ncbi:MAG: alpha-glucan family phosphorylase [Desulforhopalus sp.]|nr:alpha-glucan family phosphorylase [Desulforhopalus sp.]